MKPDYLILKLIVTFISMAVAATFILGPDGFCIDDAWIHIAYAQSVLQGDGLSYNPKDWETGFTSPLWVLTLIPLNLFQSPVLPVKIAGVLLHGGTVWLSMQCAKELAVQRESSSVARDTAITGILVGTLPSVLHGVTSGMELPLASAASMGVLYGILSRSKVWAAFGAAACVLSRPEGLVLVLLFGAFAIVRQYRAAALAAAIGAIGAQIVTGIYFWSVSGFVLPNTYYVKSGSLDISGLSYIAENILPVQPWIVSLTGVILIALAFIQDFRQRRLELTLIFSAALLALLSIAVSRHFGLSLTFMNARYFTFLLPLLVLPLASGLQLISFRWLRILMFLPLFAVSLHLIIQEREAQHSETVSTRLHVDVAHWVAKNLPVSATIGIEAAGALRVLTPRTMTLIDYEGLNNRTIAHVRHKAEKRAIAVVNSNPDFLVVPESWAGAMTDYFKVELLVQFVDPSSAHLRPPGIYRVYIFKVNGRTPLGESLWKRTSPLGLQFVK